MAQYNDPGYLSAVFRATQRHTYGQVAWAFNITAARVAEIVGIVESKCAEADRNDAGTLPDADLQRLEQTTGGELTYQCAYCGQAQARCDKCRRIVHRSQLRGHLGCSVCLGGNAA